MMKFSDHLKPAQEVALHYANKLKNSLAARVLAGEKDISTVDEAVELTRFFWEMTDCAVDDQKGGVEVAGTSDLEHWMERLMNVFIGYFKDMGFQQQWIEESNRINGHA
ncbi:hypothetical protein [Microbulbifer sp.]|uniref:hypothetical protein n=1 Tax=Microbulbifer sp. TaxID=1908541 RepID=UPI003F3FC944